MFRNGWPTGTKIVDLKTSSSDFYTNLVRTVSEAGSRCVVQLGEGTYSLNSFRLAGTSGDPTYAFGIFLPNLQGFLGQGAGRTTIQMSPRSMSSAQLSRVAEMATAAFAPLQMAMCRFDGSATSPVLISGVTFRAADQQFLTGVGADVPIVQGQPAPHQGVFIYSGAHSRIGYTRFQAAGRACTSQPPFECANLTSHRGVHRWHHLEFDGRRAPEIDPAQPRRCGPVMANNATTCFIDDSWLHHSNVSRYAVNDQNSESQGAYRLRRVRAWQITNTKNTDPALNGGQSLGGWSNASIAGWESCNGTITVEDCDLSQDNGDLGSAKAMHFSLTTVGHRNPVGGIFRLRGGVFHNTGFPSVDDYVTFRISRESGWWTGGLDNTIDAQNSDGQKLWPYVWNGPWPPTREFLTSVGVSPQTHYIVKPLG